MKKYLKVSISIVVIALIVLGSYIGYINSNKSDLSSVNKIVITNIHGKELELDYNETKELINSMGELPLEKENDRVKTPFHNVIKFYSKLDEITKEHGFDVVIF
jgi:hypothetical protein